MLLAIDIGNTHIGLGAFEDDALRATWDIATAIHRTPDEYAVLLLNLLQMRGLDKTDIDKVSLCSVVPPLTPVFQELSQSYFHVAPIVVGAGIKPGHCGGSGCDGQ